MQKITYHLIRSKRKTISLSITQEGALVVRAPLKTPLDYINGVVEGKRRWIEGKQKLVREQEALHEQRDMGTGEDVLYLGKTLLLVFSEKVAVPEIIGDTLALPKRCAEHPAAAVKAWYAVTSQRYFANRTDHYSRLYGIPYRSIGVTDARGRWGSCSSRSSINFSFRLILCPPDVIDYVVVHELTHILHLNHSPAFWQAVEHMMPDYRLKKKWLKENAGILKLI